MTDATIHGPGWYEHPTVGRPTALNLYAYVRRRWNVLLVYLIAIFLTSSHGSAELIYPLNLVRLHNPLDLVGVTVFLFGLGAFALRIPGGAWYRFAHSRLLIAGSLALMSASTIAMAGSGWWAIQAAAGLVHGAGYGLASTFMLAVLIDETAGEVNPAVTMAWYTGAISTGYAIGSPLAGLTIHSLGYGAAFWISGLVGIAGAALALAIRRSPATGGAAPRPAAIGFWRLMLGIPGLPATVWLAALLVFYINFLSDTIGPFFPIYALGVGISVTTVGYLRSFNSITAAAIRFAPILIVRYAKAGLINHLSVVVMAVASVALSMFTNVAVLAGIFAVLGLCRGLIRVTSATMVAGERERLGPNQIGIASGLYNMGLDAGSMLAPPLTGFLATAYGIPATFRMVAISLPILYYVVWFLQRALAGRKGPAPVEAKEASP